MSAFNYRRELEREAGVTSYRQNRLIRWEEIHNPIPESLNEADYRLLFGNQGSERPFFVPYAGWGYNSIHSYLDLLVLLAKLADTHGSCIKSQRFMCFGGPLSIVGDRQNFSFQEETEISTAEKEAYLNIISRYLPEFDAKQIMEDAFTWGKKTGDRWYLLEGDDTMARIQVLDPRNCLYYVDPKTPYKVVAVGEGRMNNDRIQREEYMLVPEYPQMGEYNGGWRTILHFKDGNNIWYGRPDSEQGLITMFREYKDDEYFLKASANHFTGRAILEFEDDPIPDDDNFDVDAQEDGYGDFSAQVDANMTNKAADPMAFMMMTRPYGASASVLHQIASNTPEGFFNFLNQTSLTKIIMAHQWSQKLLGLEDSNGLSTNQFWDVFNIKRLGVIQKYQDKLSGELKKCMDVIGEMYGFENNLRFLATTPFDRQKAERDEMANQMRQNTTPEEDGTKEDDSNNSNNT